MHLIAPDVSQIRARGNDACSWVDMAMMRTPVHPEPSRAEVEILPGCTVLEFGASWCGYCIAAQPALAAGLAAHPQVRHVKIEDGPGRPLGRSFRVKLWPTLVFLNDGREVERLVRPADGKVVAGALERLARADVLR